MAQNFKVKVNDSFEYNFKSSDCNQLDLLKLSKSKFHVLNNNKPFVVALKKMIFLHTNGYGKDLPQYYKNIVVRTHYPTNSSIDLIKYAVSGLERIYKEGYQYKKAGVIVMGITPENTKQFTLFTNENPKHLPLMKTIDNLNKSIGQNKVKLASQDLGRTWKMKQEKLSPRYTTKLTEVINVY